MKRIEYTLTDEYGMHARPASRLVNISQNYHSSIEIKCKAKIGNMKSMISILSLGIKQGENFCIEIEGEDEEEAYQALEKMLREDTI